MPIATHCPKCAAKFRLPDELAGRRVKCQKCGGIFQAPAAADQPPVEEEIIQGSLAEEEETDSHEETSRRGIQASAKAALPAASQGEDDEAAPSSRKERRDGRDDESADEFDDGPARRRSREGGRPRRARSGADPWVLIGIFGGIVLAAGAIVASFLFVSPAQQPAIMFNGGPGGGFVAQPVGNGPPLDPARFEVAKFDGNAFNVKDTLKLGDPIDPKRGLPCKVYRADFQAGKTYQIDQRSFLVDSHLRLESPQGVQVAENDDFGEGLNSRIRYTATETGTFRVIAGTHNGRLGEFTLDIREEQGGVNVNVAPKKVEVPPDVPEVKVVPRPVQAVAVAGDAPLTIKESLLPTDPPTNNRPSREIQIKLDVATTYRFEIDCPNFRPMVTLRDGAATIRSTLAAGNKATFTYSAAKTASFGLFVGAFPTGQGDFTVTVQKTNAAQVPAGKENAVALTVTPKKPAETSGEIHAGQEKAYRFVAIKTATYTIEVQSEDFAPVLKLTPEKGGAPVEVRVKDGEKSIRYEFRTEISGFTQLAISAADRKAGKFSLTIRR